MVTRKNSTAGRHCLCDTIETMLPDASDAVRPLLKRLFNQEVYLYALHAVKDQTVNPESWRGFHAREDPLKFVMLAGLSTQPGAFEAGSGLGVNRCNCPLDQDEQQWQAHQYVPPTRGRKGQGPAAT